MGLNIKNEATCDAIRRLAKHRGVSLTKAVDDAVRESLARDPAEIEARYRRMTAIARDCAARIKEPYKSIDHGELLYDELGLPK